MKITGLTHPGIMLKNVFLDKRGLNGNALALKIEVPAQRINEILHCKRSITPSMALRLARYLRTPPFFWFEVQSKYEFVKAKKELGEKINRRVCPSPKLLAPNDLSAIRKKGEFMREAESTHPGIILKNVFLDKRGLNGNALALKIKVPAQRINEILHCKRSITPDTALRLARYLRTPPFFWFELQCMYEFVKAKKELGEKIEKEVSLGPRVKSIRKKLSLIKQKSSKVFKCKEDLKIWFDSEVKAFGGKSPWEMIKTPQGIDRVLVELERLHIKYGTIQGKLLDKLIRKGSRNEESDDHNILLFDISEL